jgi:hypothetical protein
MSQRTIILIAMTLGSIAGGFIPSVFGAGAFSGWGIFGSAVGGFAGIYVGYKLSQ